MRLKPTETEPPAGIRAVHEAGEICRRPPDEAPVAFQIEERVSDVEREALHVVTATVPEFLSTRLAV